MGVGGNNRQQKKSSSGFFSIFNIFTSNKKHRAGYYDANDYRYKVWHSDEDKGNFGAAEPNIDMKADAFIRWYKQRVSESSCYQVDPTVLSVSSSLWLISPRVQRQVLVFEHLRSA